MINDAVSTTYFVRFAVIIYSVIIAGIVARWKKPEEDLATKVFSIGYMIFYFFAMSTSTASQVYVYIVPMLVVLIITHKYKYMII